LWWFDLSWLPDAHLTACSPHCSTGQKEKVKQKSSWVEITTRASPNNYNHGKTRLDSGKNSLIYCQLKKE